MANTGPCAVPAGITRLPTASLIDRWRGIPQKPSFDPPNYTSRPSAIANSPVDQSLVYLSPIY